MAIAYSHYTPVQKRIWYFARQRIYEINALIPDLMAEKQMWEELLPTLGVCEYCNGHGSLRDRIDVDEWGPSYECPKCKGTGFKAEEKK